jgi:putative ABC transport system ATP-binding protein
MDKIVFGTNLVKTFGEGPEKRSVLDGVTVEITAGEFVAVMGPSGSGKSTLLFALSGMDSIDGGEVFFGGQSLSALNENGLADLRRTQMGFVFQQPTLLRNLNILDNILLPALRDNKADATKLIQKAKKLMEKTGIAGLEQRNITQVSGGQLQRVGICRALLNAPRIIFGDEPTGALNSQTAQEIMDILLQINSEGTTVALVTHDPKVAAQAERVLMMCDGKIVGELRFPKGGGIERDARVNRIMEQMREIGI